MTLVDTILELRDAITVKRVFGEPYEKDGVTVIPAAFVAGGGGGGTGKSADDEGSGGGFGMVAFPIGAYVIKNGDVRWRPAVNVNLLAAGLMKMLGATAKRRAKRRRS